MAIIELKKGGYAFDFSNLAFQGLLEYIVRHSSDVQFSHMLEEAGEYGYLSLDELNTETLRWFVDLTRKYSEMLLDKEGIPPEYSARFANLSTQLDQWLVSLL